MQLLRKLAESPDELFQLLKEVSPRLLHKLTYAKLHEERATALSEFKAQLDRDKPEEWWQQFFQKHTWIFGYGLNYKFIRIIQAKPTYGVPDVSGRGAKLGDFLGQSEADAKFTV